MQTDSWHGITITPEHIVAFLPMSPQSNHLYGGARMGRRYPMPKLVEFKSKIQTIKLSSNFNQEEQRILASYQQVPITLRREFYFLPERVFTKRGTIKKMDVSNRIKAIDDALMVLFGIDDSYVFFASEEKCLSKTQDEFVRLTIKPHKL